MIRICTKCKATFLHVHVFVSLYCTIQTHHINNIFISVHHIVTNAIWFLNTITLNITESWFGFSLFNDHPSQTKSGRLYEAIHENWHQHHDQETRQAKTRRVFFHEASRLDGVGVCYPCVYGRQSCTFLCWSLEPVWMARWSVKKGYFSDKRFHFV